MNIKLKPRTDRPALRLEFIGRFGNQCFSYAHARALCEKNGWELRCAMWPGKFLFEDCNDPEPDGTEEHVHQGYCQKQKDLIYKRSDCLRWFKLDQDVKAALAPFKADYKIVAHNRVGDYGNLGFVLVNPMSVVRTIDELRRGAARKWKADVHTCLQADILTEENPRTSRMMPDWCSFMPDFYSLMTAHIVIRGNSTFSWWAATLNEEASIILSPYIKGLKGGHTTHDVPYVLGNWPMMSETAETGEDLHLPE